MPFAVPQNDALAAAMSANPQGERVADRRRGPSVFRRAEDVRTNAPHGSAAHRVGGGHKGGAEKTHAATKPLPLAMPFPEDAARATTPTTRQETRFVVAFGRGLPPQMFKITASDRLAEQVLLRVPGVPSGTALVSLHTAAEVLDACASQTDTVALAKYRALIPQLLLAPHDQQSAFAQLERLPASGFDKNTYGLLDKAHPPRSIESFAEWFRTPTSESMAQLRCVTGFVPIDLGAGGATEPRKLKGLYTAKYDHAVMHKFCVLVGQVPDVMTGTQVARIVAEITGRDVARVDMVPSYGTFKVWFASEEDAEYAASLTQTAVMAQGGLLVGDTSSAEAAAETRRQLIVTRIFLDMSVREELSSSKHPLAKMILAAHEAQEKNKNVRRVIGEMPVTLRRGTGETIAFGENADFKKADSLGCHPVAQGGTA